MTMGEVETRIRNVMHRLSEIRDLPVKAQLAVLGKVDDLIEDEIITWEAEHCLADDGRGGRCGYRLEDPSDEHCPEHREGDEGWED